MEIFNWARNNGYVVLTHDLDIGNILAITNAEAPSVIQIRTLDITPENLLPKIHAILNDFEIQLNQGVLVVLEETSARYRILPLTRQ